MKYQKFLNEKIQCLICPRKCLLGEGQRGFCYVRKNIGPEIVLESYGYNTGLAIDPVEKKPLYQFYPNSKVLSFGTIGCNMGCLYCQNYQTTKVRLDIKENCLNATPQQIVEVAKAYNCECVAFTYNDPIIFFEYAIDTAKLCKKEGIKTIAVTSGYINPEPAKEFFEVMDGANIDLKGFSEDFYSKNCMAHLQPVLDTIKYVANETNCHVELTTMLIENENTQHVEKECQWILDNIGDSVPLHFSAFFPRYKFSDRQPTKFATLENAYNLAKYMGLKYVYTGNLSNIETSSTYCKNCAKAILVRNGYELLENNIIDGKCKFCKTPVDGRFI